VTRVPTEDWPLSRTEMSTWSAVGMEVPVS
jgi:hypothetical protein